MFPVEFQNIRLSWIMKISAISEGKEVIIWKNDRLSLPRPTPSQSPKRFVICWIYNLVTAWIMKSWQMVQSFWCARNAAILRRSVQHANFPAKPKSGNNLNGWRRGLPNPFLQLWRKEKMIVFRTSSYPLGWLSDALVQCPSQRFEHNDGPCPTSCDLTGLVG